MTLLRRSFLALVAVLSAAFASAQVPYPGGTYLQSFDTLPTSPGSTTVQPATAGVNGPLALDASPTNATGLPGWSYARYGGTGNGVIFIASNGSSNTGAVFSYGAASSTERALGSLCSNGHFGRFGVAFTNNTGGTISAFTLAYTGEQWRRGAGAIDVLTFAYAIGASDINTGSFTDVSALSFTAPLIGAGDAATVGNDPGSKVALSATVSGLNWAPGQVLVLRWTDASDPGNDDGLAIDDLSFSTTSAPVGTPPTIDTPPASQTVTEGDTVHFTVAASGTAPLSYQWHKVAGANPGPLSNGPGISGALTDHLILTGVAVAQGGSYNVVVSNVAGNVPSATANLTVNPLLLPPAITTQPASVVVAPGGSANFTVTATGTAPLVYTWRRNGVVLANGPTIAGATTASLTVSSVTGDVAGGYDVVVSNGVNPDATSGTAILSLPSIITPSSPIAYTSQIAYVGGTYAQSFDTLPASGAITLASTGASVGPLGLDVAPINAPGLAGWSLAKYAGTATAPFLFRADDGGSISGSVYSYGTGAAPDRGLGSLASGSTESRFGAAIVNSTGRTITQFTLTYTGEQWRRGTAAIPNKLAFAYAFNPTNINTGTFTAVTALDFTAPVTTGSGAALNGNLPANRAAVAATVSGLTWEPGQVLVLRWTDTDDTGSDDGLAIDNLTFSTPVATTDILPAVIYTVPANGVVNVATNSPITVMFNEAVNFTASSFMVTGETSGAHVAAVSGGLQSYTLTPAASFNEDETVVFDILAAQVTDAATGTHQLGEDFTASFITFSSLPIAIHKVQGSGLASAYTGYPVSVQGVVTASFQGVNQVGGFYLEAPDALHDANPATSEGILVFDNANSVAVGDVVTVTGTVTEYGDAPTSGTEITALTFFSKVGTDNLPAATPVSLPFPSATYAERYEGMRVTLPQTLTVTNNYNHGIFGELSLSNGRLATPTNVVAPGGPAQTLEAANQLNQIALDDGMGGENPPDPTPYLADSAGRGLTRRTGSTTSNVTGILDQKFGGYIIEPTATVDFTDANPRSDPPAVAGSLKIAIGNVLNFFNGDGAGGGFPTSRGASNYAEYLRQRGKIVAGITALGADIMGLTELENDGYGSTSSIADLVNGLNAAAPSGTTYAYVSVGSDIVTDVIHCGFIYRVETVVPVGLPAMLSHPSFNNLSRNPLAQTFRQLSTGGKLTVSINHFRAKASVAPGAGNPDSGDGQGNNNALRLQEAVALTDWLATDPTGSGDPDFLIIGDLNAAAKEDPIVAIESAGYVNLTEAAEGVGGYSYQFAGAFGHLDHALANDHLAGQVADAATWHVNSDEPIYYDYNTEDKSPAQQAINVTGPYRYSDHDPVVVGLNLQPDAAPDVTAQLQITKSSLVKNLVTKRYTQIFTVKNISATPLANPVSIILDGLSPNATLFNASGFTSVITPLNSPYVNLNVGADNILSPNEAVTRVVEYTNPTNGPITYTIKAVAGPGGR